jgi:hypothetical protein
MTDVLKHVEYIIWSAKAVKLANMEWRARRPYRGDTLMTTDGLHHWLFHWAVDSGRIEDPGPVRRQGYSAFVAVVFDRDPGAVKDEARAYWRLLVAEQGR